MSSARERKDTLSYYLITSNNILYFNKELFCALSLLIFRRLNKGQADGLPLVWKNTAPNILNAAVVARLQKNPCSSLLNTNEIINMHTFTYLHL